MPLYTPEAREKAKQVEADVVAAIVHQWLVRVQAYTEKTIQSKWEALQAKEGRDEEELTKLSNWLTYLRFNAYALNEIEEGGLDDWFRNLFEQNPPASD
ncbi:MAG: hypothetical protein RX316_01040 [bacterium]|nr:hypothetical protein [bacterium]